MFGIPLLWLVLTAPVTWHLLWLYTSFANGGLNLPSFVCRTEYSDRTRVIKTALYLPEQMTAEDFDMLSDDDCYEVLERRPELVECIPSGRLHDGRQLGRLVKRYPILEDSIDYSNLKDYDIVYFLDTCPHLVDKFDINGVPCKGELLIRHPEWEKKFDFAKFGVSDWTKIVLKTSAFDSVCDFSKFGGWAWQDILIKTERLDAKCDFSKLNGYNWSYVLAATKRFDDKFDGSKFNGRDWGAVLKARPDLSCVCSNLLRGAEVALFLQECPWMTNMCDFASMRPLDWGELLKDNPQFLNQWDCHSYRDEEWHEFANGYFNFVDGAEQTTLKIKGLHLCDDDQKHLKKFLVMVDERDIKDKRLKRVLNSANRGDKVAANCLGKWYQGLDCHSPVERDDNMAVAWYMKGVNAGNTESMARLGDCYRYGIGVQTNHIRAVELYKMSAAQRCVLGVYQLGECMLLGIGTDRNYDEALKNFNLAANMDGADKALQRRIYYRLGRCYEEGLGAKEDFFKAKIWYDKAAKAGCKLSKAKLELIEQKLGN